MVGAGTVLARMMSTFAGLIADADCGAHETVGLGTAEVEADVGGDKVESRDGDTWV